MVHQQLIFLQNSAIPSFQDYMCLNYLSCQHIYYYVTRSLVNTKIVYKPEEWFLVWVNHKIHWWWLGIHEMMLHVVKGCEDQHEDPVKIYLKIIIKVQKSAMTSTYYTASSASGQDGPNRALWLATRAGKMAPSCPLGTTRCIPQAKFHHKPYNKSFIDQVCSVKMAGYWPRSFFCEFMDLDFVSVHKHAKKELGQYPAILTSHLVNNPYILIHCIYC